VVASVSAKPGFLEAKARMEAWWAGSSLGRPVVSARIRKPGAPPPPADGRSRAERELDPEWYLRSAEWTLSAHDWPAETMPGLYPEFGSNLVIPGVLAGAKLDYRPDTTWMRPIPDVYERPLPEFSSAHPIFRLLDCVQRRCAERFGERGLLSPPPTLDGMTTLSALRTPEQLCLDVIERPDDVKRVAAGLNDLLFEAHRAFFSTLQQFGHAQTVTWAGIYAPGKCEMVQCDFGIMLSPAMYEEFVLPELRRMTEYFEYSCYHLDGTPQTRFLDLLCRLPRLHAIQWNPEPPALPPLEWLDFYREVRRRRRSLWIACDAPTAVELTRRLGPDGLMFSVGDLKSVDEVEGLLHRLAKASSTA
jgi:hypothetical protein